MMSSILLWKLPIFILLILCAPTFIKTQIFYNRSYRRERIVFPDSTEYQPDKQRLLPKSLRSIINTPLHYHDFTGIFHDIAKKSDAHEYNETAETEGIHDDFNGRSIVAPGQYPHMAALGFRNRRTHRTEYKCGGSLINEYFVITAAHCLHTHLGAPDIVKLGDIRLKEWMEDVLPQRRRVARTYTHPAYNKSCYYHDIGLIKLQLPAVYTWFVRPIRLWVRSEIPYTKVHTMGYGATGFGEAQTNVLTELELSIVPTEECNSTLPMDESAPNGIVDSQICAHDYEKLRDTCQGDSGGPLQLNLERRRHRRHYRYYLIGITSYGAYCRSEYPGVYTRVSSYTNWIVSIVWPKHFLNLSITNKHRLPSN